MAIEYDATFALVDEFVVSNVDAPPPIVVDEFGFAAPRLLRSARAPRNEREIAAPRLPNDDRAD